MSLATKIVERYCVPVSGPCRPSAASGHGQLLKIHLQQLAVADLARIVADLHRLRVTGIAVADLIVMRRAGLAAGIARHGLGHAAHVLENACTPQKQPPAKTAVSVAAVVAGSSSAGAGRGTASSAAAAGAWPANMATATAALAARAGKAIWPGNRWQASWRDSGGGAASEESRYASGLCRRRARANLN